MLAGLFAGRMSSRGSDRVRVSRPDRPVMFENHLTRPDPTRPVRFPTPPNPTRLNRRVFLQPPDPIRGPSHDPRKALDISAYCSVSVVRTFFCRLGLPSFWGDVVGREGDTKSRYRRGPPTRRYPDIRRYPYIRRSKSLGVTGELHS